MNVAEIEAHVASRLAHAEHLVGIAYINGDIGSADAYKAEVELLKALLAHYNA